MTTPLAIFLYDTMSGQKRLFTPRVSGKVGMYVCGMTVYDYCHIGHARVMVSFDVIVRWLRHAGYQVDYVRNITDIDDKIIQRAADNGESISDLTARFIAAMQEDAAKLGCQPPTYEPKATDYITQMQAMITTLQQQHLAYQGQGGDVYYAVENFPDYGKLSKRKLADMQAGARIEVEGDKQSPFDFVLWKAAKPEEPQWQSPWGAGRPGWHIECSAMSTCCLGANFDIHGGGHDLQFPHHENEIAQSEGATGQTYANNWMHVGFVNVDGEKMSKSLGNFFTIREVMARFHPETIRFFILSSHYRNPINFSDAALQEAHSGLTRLYQALKAAGAQPQNQPQAQANPQNPSDTIDSYERAFNQAMCDDFNTAAAISVLFQLAKDINKALADNEVAHAQQLAACLQRLAAPLNILQLAPNAFLQAQIGEADQSLSDDAIEQLLAERQQAKAEKNFAQADAIRKQLQEQGVELEDGKTGTTWRRV